MAAIFKKMKNHNISATDGSISTTFGMVMCLRLGPLHPSANKILCFKTSIWWHIAIWKIKKVMLSQKTLGPISAKF